MSTARSVHRVFVAFSRTYIQSRPSFAPVVQVSKSPFYRLFSRHLSRPSIRHRLAQRDFSTKTRLREEANRAHEAVAEAPKSLSQRLKDLSREYGWTAVGVYFALSALDFPFCFLAVRWIGTEKIAALEHRVVEWVKRASPVQIPEKYRFWKKSQVINEAEQLELEYNDHGYKEAEKANSGTGASLGTQLALAYAIHKSFIFIRVPLTAAILPKIVKTLRGWGWKIGKRTPKVSSKPTTPDISKTG